MEGGYILKPPVAHYPEMAELEHLTMRMAACFKIARAKCGLIPLTGGQLAFITKGMDRDGKETLHMEDMCQLTDRLTEQKCRGSMEKVGKTVLRYCTTSLFDTIRLFETVIIAYGPHLGHSFFGFFPPSIYPSRSASDKFNAFRYRFCPSVSCVANRHIPATLTT